MELWIRTQNKLWLEKCNGLYISHSDKDVWSIINSFNLTVCGRYKTKERALEVLDDIQKHIELINVNGDLFKTIYEMPKE